MSLIKQAKSIKQMFNNEDLTPAQKAMLLAGGTSAAYAVPKSLTEHLYDTIERSHPTMTMDEMLQKIKPGDIIHSRVSPQGSANPSLGELFHSLKDTSVGKRQLPIKMNQIIQMVLGSPYTHTSMKMEHGNDILNVMLGNEGARMEDMAKALRNEEFKVYRPFGNTPKQHADAMKGLGSLVGKPYRDTKGVIETGLRTLLDPLGTETSLENLKSCRGQTCTTAVGNAYPHIFPTEEAVTDSLRGNPRLEFVGRYNPGGILPSNYEKFVTRFASPLLKSLKYALPVGAAAYGYNKYKDLKDA